GSATTSGYIVHLCEAFLLERGIPNRKDLIYHEDVGIQMSGNGKSQPHIHSTAITFNRRIEKFLHISKGSNLVEFASDLGSGHPKDGPVQKYVLATGQLRMKPRTHFEQARDSSPDSHSAPARLGDAAKDLQQGTFASTVASNDAKNLAL